jgi:hypothetical protein
MRVLPILLGLALPLAAAGPFKPTLKLTPIASRIAPGAKVTFSATINYEPDGPRYQRQPVKWSVNEGDAGGTITRTGVYTAPAKPGLYHVRAEREDFPGVFAVATMAVKLPKKKR